MLLCCYVARCAVGRLSTREISCVLLVASDQSASPLLLCKESRAALAPEKKFSLTREHFLSGEVGEKELREAENFISTTAHFATHAEIPSLTFEQPDIWKEAT